MFEALGNIGDFVGGIAVVITLIYLAVQIRHNTRGLDLNRQLMKLSCESELRRNLLDFRLAIATDEKLSEIWRHGLRAPAELLPEDRQRFDLLINNLTAMMHGQFEANSQGLLEFTQMPFLRLVAAQPGFRDSWRRLRLEIESLETELRQPAPNQEFVRYVESIPERQD